MIFEELKKSDIPELTSLAKRILILDELSEDIIYEKSFGDPFYQSDLNWVAREDNKMVGFLIGAFRNYEKGKLGYIKLMGVLPQWRRKSVGKLLLERIEDVLRKQDVTEIKVMDVPLNYFMPGLDPRYTEGVVFLQQNGFEKVGENINMDVDLTSIDLETSEDEKRLSKEGIYIRRAEHTDYTQIIKFIESEWKLWAHEVSQAFDNKPISLHIAQSQDQIVAFSAYNGNNRGLPWFGPMGTDKSMRGKKIGEILLKRCLADQKTDGFSHSIIPWVGPAGFYLKAVNAHISRIFWTYKKSLS